MEIAEAIEKAKTISQVLQLQDQLNQNSNSLDFTANPEKIVNLIKLINQINNSLNQNNYSNQIEMQADKTEKDNTEENNAKNNTENNTKNALENLEETGEGKKTEENLEKKLQPIHNIEQDLQTPAIRTIKAAIPYLDFEYQRNIGIMVKIIELDSLLKKYKNTATVMETTRKKGWQKEMLLSMKPELDKRNQYYIDMIVRFMDIKDIMSKLNLEEEQKNAEQN